MVVCATELERDACILVDGLPCVVVDSLRVKYGKAAAFVRVELRDLASGVVHHADFRLTDRFESFDLSTKSVRYLREDGDRFVFMDVETRLEIEVPSGFIGEYGPLLRVGDEWGFSYVDGKLYAAAPPLKYVM